MDWSCCTGTGIVRACFHHDIGRGLPPPVRFFPRELFILSLMHNVIWDWVMVYNPCLQRWRSTMRWTEDRRGHEKLRYPHTPGVLGHHARQLRVNIGRGMVSCFCSPFVVYAIIHISYLDIWMMLFYRAESYINHSLSMTKHFSNVCTCTVGGWFGMQGISVPKIRTTGELIE